MEITTQTQEVSMHQSEKRKDERNHWSNGQERGQLTKLTKFKMSTHTISKRNAGHGYKSSKHDTEDSLENIEGVVPGKET